MRRRASSAAEGNVEGSAGAVIRTATAATGRVARFLGGENSPLVLRCNRSGPSEVRIADTRRSDMTRIKPIAMAAMLCGAVAASAVHAQAASHPGLNAQLLVGARQADIAQVERTLAQGAAPDSRNRLGKTALLIAAEKGEAAIAERLLQAGADVNLASIEGVTPLMAASYGGHPALVRPPLAAGAPTRPPRRSPTRCPRARRRRRPCGRPGSAPCPPDAPRPRWWR